VCTPELRDTERIALAEPDHQYALRLDAMDRVYQLAVAELSAQVAPFHLIPDQAFAGFIDIGRSCAELSALVNADNNATAGAAGCCTRSGGIFHNSRMPYRVGFAS
jgi:hypothetical protein